MAKRSKKSIRAWRVGTGLFVLFLFAFVALYIGVPSLGHERYENTESMAAVPAVVAPAVPVRQATHVPTPAAVKGIYMTSCVASSKSLRDNLIKLIDETELNAVVIDVKSFDGRISFMPADPELKNLPAIGGGCFVKDMQDLIDTLHEHGIYVISRVATFQDQFMVKERPEWAVKKASATSTVWRDYKGIAWIDASTKEYWKYIVSIAKAAHAIGVDEINFDYIRFPADGDMRDIWYPLSGDRKKSDVMREFYQYLHSELAPEGIVTSADIFGMTSTNEDDLNIGQILENALPNFDYIDPMTYPSHYPVGFFNLGDPNQHVYDVVKISMDHAIARTIASTTAIELPGARIGTSTPAVYAKPSFDKSKIRPWLQDNNYPVTYTPKMVRDQIQAAYDAGVTSWMLWNAGNRYTRSALEAATSTPLVHN